MFPRSRRCRCVTLSLLTTTEPDDLRVPAVRLRARLRNQLRTCFLILRDSRTLVPFPHYCYRAVSQESVEQEGEGS